MFRIPLPQIWEHYSPDGQHGKRSGPGSWIRLSAKEGFNLRGKMMQPVQSYIRAQGLACAVINAVLNPAITWLGNRRMAFVPLSGDSGIIIDIAVTSIVLSRLVSLFVTPAARREFRAGRLTGSDTVLGRAGLAHLPSKAWSFGLVIGVVATAVVTPLVFATFRVLGSAGLSFAGFIILLKAVYTAALAFVVTRCVILRQMFHCRANPAHTG